MPSECDGHKITRNIKLYKKVNNDLECEHEDDDEIHVKDNVRNIKSCYCIQVWEKMLYVFDRYHWVLEILSFICYNANY